MVRVVAWPQVSKTPSREKAKASFSPVTVPPSPVPTARRIISMALSNLCDESTSSPRSQAISSLLHRPPSTRLNTCTYSPRPLALLSQQAPPTSTSALHFIHTPHSSHQAHGLLENQIECFFVFFMCEMLFVRREAWSL